MPALERLIGKRGARFYGEGARIMFVNHLDGSTRDGPRPATEADSVAHVEAWASFTGDLPEGDPLKAMVSFDDPDEVPPEPEPGPHAKKREAARAAGAEA